MTTVMLRKISRNLNLARPEIMNYLLLKDRNHPRKRMAAVAQSSLKMIKNA